MFGVRSGERGVYPEVAMRHLAPCVAVLAILVTSASAQTSGVSGDDSLGSVEPATVVDARPSLAFRDLVRQVRNDFRHVVSWDAATITAIAGLGSLAVHPKDPTITRWASERRHLETVLDGGAKLGDIATQSGSALAAILVGKFSKHPQLTEVGLEVARAQFMAGTFTMGLKLSVDRTRPDGYRYSLPSGHASSAFATAAVLHRRFGWKAGLPAYLAGTYVGASRLTENRHYLTDVAFGAALGLVAGRAVTIGHGRATFAVTPVATRGGSGVGLTLTSAREPAASSHANP
jgi:membrane-associated phospholipid phosphatase